MINWIFRSLLLGIVIFLCAQYLHGIKVDGLLTAIKASILIAVANATLGTVLRLVTLPLTWITLGGSSFIISIFIIGLVSHFLPGFDVVGISTYFQFGAILAIARILIGFLFKD